MQLSDFKTYVKYDWKRTDKDTELVQFYNDMIVWVASQIPNPGYKFQSYATVSKGVEDISLPTNIVHLLHPIRYLKGTGTSDIGWNLIHLTKKEYDRWEPNPNRTNPHEGHPWAYTVFSNSILVTPPFQDSSALLEINWTKQTTDMSDDADIPSLPTEWEEVLKQGTLERLFASIGLFQESEFWGKKYHIITGRGDDVPFGLCKRLLEIEEDREDLPIGQVQVNNL